MPKYIECAGLRIPRDWTPYDLQKALEKRNIRLDNEDDVMEVYGHSIAIKFEIDKEIDQARADLIELETAKRKGESKIACVNCGFVPTATNIKKLLASPKGEMYGSFNAGNSAAKSYCQGLDPGGSSY